MNNKNSKKGFLFLVTVFLILTYILLSLSVWVKSIEASERSYSEFYKESNVELAIEQITEEKLDAVSTKVMNRGLLKLTTHSADYSFIEGPSGDEYANVRYAFREWLQNGSPKSSYFDGGTAPSEYNSSMAAWVDNLNASLSAIGVYVDEFNVSDFNIRQVSADKLNYSFKVDLGMKDISGTTTVRRTYEISNLLNLSGIPDPAIMRETNGKITSRRFFFNPNYNETGDLEPSKIATGTEGQGWFYGYLTSVSAASSVPTYEKGRYILVGTYTELAGLSDLERESFGAFIVTTEPVLGTVPCNGTYYDQSFTFNPVQYSGTNCDAGLAPTSDGKRTSKPYVVAKNFNITSASICPAFNTTTGYKADRRCALIVAVAEPYDYKKKASGPVAIYDVESIRDFTLCGYYVHNENSPSFMQRLLNNSYNRTNKEFGIETFLIGNYSKSALGPTYEDKSKLDRELFATPPVSGVFIRGLPGCKDSKMCGDANTPTWRFALSTGAIKEYKLGDISCDNKLAGCK